MKYAVLWFVLVIAIAGGLGCLNVPTYRQLVAYGVPGRATVVELLPANHNSLRYEYQVDGRTLQGQMQSWPPNPPLEQIKVGQTVVIYYDSAHPGVSVLGNPHGMLENKITSVGLAAIGLPTLLVIAWVYSNFRKQAVA